MTIKSATQTASSSEIAIMQSRSRSRILASMKRLSEKWQPLLVRPLEESKFEVVIGARRLKAARLAELESLPVRVVKLTDADDYKGVLTADNRASINAYFANSPFSGVGWVIPRAWQV
jgi:hypothetical protein